MSARKARLSCGRVVVQYDFNEWIARCSETLARTRPYQAIERRFIELACVRAHLLRQRRVEREERALPHRRRQEVRLEERQQRQPAREALRKRAQHREPVAGGFREL